MQSRRLIHLSIHTKFYQDLPSFVSLCRHSHVLFAANLLDALRMLGLLSLCLGACAHDIVQISGCIGMGFLLKAGMFGPKEIPFGRGRSFFSPHFLLPLTCLPDSVSMWVRFCSAMKCTAFSLCACLVSVRGSGHAGFYHSFDLYLFVFGVLIIFQVIISVVLDSIGFCSLSPPSPMSRRVSFIVKSP